MTPWKTSTDRTRQRKRQSLVNALYRSLDATSQEIRLIDVEPGEGDAEISCSIRYESVQDPNLRFEALSYTWGNGKSTLDIAVQGQTMPVTENLYWALNHLRLPNAVRVIWIDAICINQKDIQERTQQVSLMRSIYSSAFQVIVWLGREMAYPNSRWLGPCKSNLRLAASFIQHPGDSAEPERWFRSTIGKAEHIEHWKAVMDILLRPYWERVWIVQEVVLASKLFVQCGSVPLSWTYLLACDKAWVGERLSHRYTNDLKLEAWFRSVEMSVWRFAPPMRVFWRYFGRRIHLHEGLYSLWDFHTTERMSTAKSMGLACGPATLDEDRRRFKQSNSGTLLDFLTTHWVQKSSDTHDKVFGLTGLASDCADGKYPVSYAVSIRQTYHDFIAFYLGKHKSLDVLCYAGLHLCYPSWMLAWEPSGNARFFDPLTKNHWLWYVEPRRHWPFKANPHRVRHPATQYALINKRQKFRAAKDTSAQAIVGREHLGKKDYLLVEGVCIDHIAGLIDCCGSHKSREMDWDLGATRKKRPDEIISYIAKKTRLTVNQEPITYAQGEYKWLLFREDIEMAKRIKNLYQVAMAVSGPSIISGRATASKKERTEELWRTLIFNRLSDGSEASCDMGVAFEVLVNEGQGVPDDFFADSGLPDLERARIFVKPYLENLTANLLTRRLFISNRGMLILGQGWAQEGDKVCVFFGCHCPMIIASWKQRNSVQENAFESILHGSAYVHGYMDGMAVDELEAGQVKARTFKLY